MPALIIPFSDELRLRLPTVVGNVDYNTLRLRLEQIDQLLLASGLETEFLNLSLERWLASSSSAPTALQQEKFQLRSRRALRCNLLRTLLQEDYRGFSCQLAGNPLYQWFCLAGGLDVVQVPSKSELQRYAHWLPAAQMRRIINLLLLGGIEQPERLELREALSLDEYFLDTTCLKANIHFPVDWVLLCDGVRTLMKATLLIRKQGLRGRMQAPEEFLRRVNRLAIEMTHQRRKKESKKGRKRVLRALKKLVGTVRGHARRHRDLLGSQWQKTSWTKPQADQVLNRIDRVLELLPKAQKQAHERIIGGRQMPNAEKILSLYETDARVVVRGKAGADVEFGNTALVGENSQGVILDFQLFKEQAPADTALLMDSLMRVWENLKSKVGAVVTDRGFHSQENSQAVDESDTFNGLCPRDRSELKERMRSERFARLQRRRSQTEGRIGILKNGFFGRPMRAKGFESRELAMAWGVLTHNLWMLARLRKKPKKIAEARAEAA